jgi:hypothetical protein
MEYNRSASAEGLPPQTVHLVTAVGPQPCQTVIGSYMSMLALKVMIVGP